MIIGFTGTSQGMTEQQRQSLYAQLVALGPGHTLVHGDCVGADAQAHFLASCRGWTIEIYPSTLGHARAYCAAPVIHPVMAPLARNKVIAKRAELMLATPREPHEVLRSGTWATIRAARKLGRDGWIILPNGGLRKLAAG